MPRVKKETEGHWDYPVLQVWTAGLGHRVLQDQWGFRDQQDQKEKGAVKEILVL